MTPEQMDKLARQAGLETGETFPGPTAWRARFAELLAEQVWKNVHIVEKARQEETKKREEAELRVFALEDELRRLHPEARPPFREAQPPPAEVPC